MSTEQLEQRLAAVEKTVAAIQQQISVLGNDPPQQGRPPQVLTPATPVDDKAWEEFQAYCQYIRKTGESPPPGWRPGDPIPDPEWWS